MHGTTTHIRCRDLITGALVLPFFSALPANGLYKIINNHSFQNNWLWSELLLTIWIFALTLAVVVLTDLSYSL